MRAGDNDQDFELNIASIIDCFTVLIAFMLASASFLSIGILDAGIAAAGASASNEPTPPTVQVAIELKKDLKVEINLSGKVTQKYTIAPKDSNYDLEGVTRQLASVKGQYAEVKGAVLSAENKVKYSEVIRAMETTKKTLPAVMLGGF